MWIFDDPLLRALRQRASAVTQRIRDAEGEVSAEDLRELENLARIVEVQKSLNVTRRRRWPVIAAVLLTVLIGSVLGFGRTAQTEIELDASVEELSFEILADQVLFEGMVVRELGLAGAAHVEIPGQEEGSYEHTPVLVETWTSGDHSGVLRIGAILAPAGTRIRLRHAGPPSRYHLTMSGSNAVLQVDLRGPTRITPAGSEAIREDFGIPRSIRAEWDSEGLDLDLEPATSSTRLAPDLKVSKLAFFRTDEVETLAGTDVRQPSTIMSGKLFLESLDGRSLELRPGQRLRFSDVSGTLDRLILGEDSLVVRFRGEVQGMETGPRETPRSLMPTWFEWLQARQGLLLLWGSTLYVIGLVTAVLRWLEFGQ